MGLLIVGYFLLCVFMTENIKAQSLYHYHAAFSKQICGNFASRQELRPIKENNKRGEKQGGECMTEGVFAVFDVETPNRHNDKMSAIGITIVKKGKITEDFYSLVNPETYFEPFNTKLTGIDTAAVQDAPTFGELWRDIEPLLSKGILVAHNATFDMGVLKKCLKNYAIPWKRAAPYMCTVQAGRKILPDIGHKLNELCEYYKIKLHHHHADSDSHACAEILLRYMQSGVNLERFVKQYSFL